MNFFDCDNSLYANVRFISKVGSSGKKLMSPSLFHSMNYHHN